MSLRPYAASLVLLPLLVRADDANWSTFGGAGAFTPNRHVRMEREDVRIALDDRAVRVHATFWFRNRGPATTVRMAFPDETKQDGVSTKPPIRRFRSSVDGRPVRVAHERLESRSNRETELTTYRSAWVKTVTFARDGARRVEVWYTADHGFAGSGWAFDTYVFRTGATWRGTIGRIDATVDWTRSRERSRPALRLTAPAEGARWTNVGYRRVHLLVENVEPRFDLDLTTIDGFWNFRLNGRPIEQSLGLEIDDTGQVVAGPPEDLRVAVDGLGRIFGRYRESANGNVDWVDPSAKRFGRSLTLLGTQTLVTGKGGHLRLAHRATDVQGKPLEKDEPPYVRLRDVFAALGGTYRSVPREERVDLNLPYKARR